MANPIALSDKQVDLLWKQFELNVDLYKFYLDMAIKINVFYYAITGGILSYYFQHSTNGIAKYALLLPVLFSLGLGGMFVYGSFLLNVVRRELFDIRDKLGLDTAPELMVLIVFLRITATIVLAVGIVLSVYCMRTF